MKQGKFDIYVFADWKGMAAPKLMGILSAHYGKGKKAFGFEYDKDWIKTASQRLIDPDIQFFSGAQFPNNKENFGVFRQYARYLGAHFNEKKSCTTCKRIWREATNSL
jgi:serine/threonine-protein kinase HipA